MANEIQFFSGDDLVGELQLKTFEDCDPNTKTPVDLTGATEIKLHFRPASGTAPIELLLTATEVSIASPATAGIINFVGSKAKGLLLAINKNLPIDAVVTNAAGKDKTYSNPNILEVKSRPAGY